MRLLLALLAFLCPAAAAQVAEEALDGPIAVLGGRLRMRLPAGATTEEGVLVTDETTIEWVGGRVVLRVVVTETARSSPRGLAAACRAMVAASEDAWEGHRIEPLPDAPIEVVLLVPSDLERAFAGAAVSLLAALVRHPDGLVQLLQFWARPEVEEAEVGPEWRLLARRIASSVEAGPRALDTAGRTERLAMPGDEVLVIDLPAGWIVGRRRRFHRVLGLDEGPLWPSASIAIEVHSVLPTPHHERDRVEAEALSGPLMGREVVWKVSTAPTGGRRAETTLEWGPRDEWLRVEVTAPDDDHLAAARSVAGTLRAP